MRLSKIVLVAASFWLSGCLSDVDLGTVEPLCPDPTDFRLVNNMLERRCGTLDCHGDLARPFTVYGQNSLRRPGGEVDAVDPDQYYTGGIEPTLEFELQGTYASACALEPEEMDAVVKGSEEPDTLTLLRKPRLDEKHKGGRLWGRGTLKGDACLVGFVTNSLDKTTCIAELEEP